MADVPNVPIPNVQIPGSDNSFKPLPFHFDTESSQYVTGPTTFNTNPELYEIDQIALQSGAKDMWNSFIRGINQTQVSSSQFKLFNNQQRIAEIEGGLSFKGALGDLESQYLNKQIDEIEYQTQKNLLSRELSSLYSDNDNINQDILSDQQDIENAPVKKSYQIREQLLQGIGADAGLLDSLVYTQPTVMGSSAATMGATLLTAFGSNLARQLATKVVGSFSTGPAAPYIATGLALGTMFETLYQARKLESQAEVGGAIAEDFELLKSQYLAANKKTELSQKEYNELIVQANKGADTQYWKNMSLAAVDAAQAMLLAGSFGKWFDGFANANKLSRIGSRAAALWLEGKSESVEEGVQYAFQTEKRGATLGNVQDDPQGFWKTVTNGKFINGLRQDYVDVLGSINYGPIKGDGKYSGDKEFEFSTESGFLMGILMGGASTTLQTAKDFHNYRQATKELQKAGVEDTEGNIFKFKSDVYKRFFEPTSSLMGVLNTSSGDRVHYLREAIKTLGSKKDGNGNTILTPQEVQQELRYVGESYRLYDNLAGYLDNISGGFRPTPLFNAAKAKFRDASFRESLQMIMQRERLNNAIATHQNATANTQSVDSELAANKALLDVINQRIERVKNLTIGEDLRAKKISYLESKKTETEQAIADQISELAELGLPTNTLATPEVFNSADNLLTAQMFHDETSSRYNDLLKVKSRKQLENWFTKTATEEAFNGWTEANEVLNDIRREEYQDEATARQAQPYADLEQEQKAERDTRNREILAQEQFEDGVIDSMSEEERDNVANDVLNSYATGTPYIDSRTFMNRISNVKSQEEWHAFYNIPGFEDWANTNLKGVTRDTNYKDVVKMAKPSAQPTNKKPNPNRQNRGNISLGRARTPNDNRTESGLLTTLKVGKDRQVQVGEVLLYIQSSPYATPAEQELARQLLRTDDKVLDTNMVFDNTIPTPAQFNVAENKISVNLQFIGADYEGAIDPFETVVLHEVLHQFTTEFLKPNVNPDLSARLNSLYNFAVTQAKQKGLFDRFYGLNSPSEMISEGFTNPQFQEFLKGLSYAPTNKTAWQTLLDLINQALRSLGINTDQTVLDELISLTTENISRRNRESFANISGRIQTELNTQITTKNSIDQNTDNAAKVLQIVYDTPNLAPSEFTTLEAMINAHLQNTNDQIRNSDKNRISFGRFSMMPGNFLILKGNKTVYTVDKKNTDGSLLLTYTYKPKGSNTAKIGSKVVSEPSDIDQIFTDKKEAINYVTGKSSTQSTPTGAAPQQSNEDAVGAALDEFVRYIKNIQNYGALDPKLLELGNKLIGEMVKSGKNNFVSISSEIVSRIGEQEYTNIFDNLRRVYTALFADTPGLTDAPGELTNLVMGVATASSILDGLKAGKNPLESTYTEGSSTETQEQELLLANTADKISGNVLKTTGQQFSTDPRGLWTNEIDRDPVKQRYYRFLERMISQTASGKTMADLGYFGLLVQDGQTLPDGTPIPHEQNTIRYFESLKAKGLPVVYGQIGLIVDKNNKPIKVDQEGNPSETGDIITFNIETSKTIANKPLDIVAATNGITTQQAKDLLSKAVTNVAKIRESAKANKPVRLELSPKIGVPIFSLNGNSTSPLANANYEIEIASVRKDDTSQGYFVNHPNQTGFLGGAYVFVNGIPVKLEPTAITEADTDLILAILDEQSNSDLNLEVKKERTKFLNNFVYQRFSKDPAAQKGTLYFRGSDVYVDGAKVSGQARKAAILNNARYNIASSLLNANWAPYTLQNGKIIKDKPQSYNSAVLSRSTTKAVIREGQQVLANSYFNYKIGSQIESWMPVASAAPATEVNPATATTPSGVLSKDYRSQNKNGDIVIDPDEFMSNVDFEETGILGFEEFVDSALELRLVNLKVYEDGTRIGLVYIDKGPGQFSGSTTTEVVFKKLPSNIKPQPTEAVAPAPAPKPAEQSATDTAPKNESAVEKKKRELREKLRRQNEALKNSSGYQAGGEDVQFYGQIEQPTVEATLNQEDLNWFTKTFAKSFSGENASREFILTSGLINSNLWGRFSENGIRLVNDAPRGVLYHEAFHEFSQMYLSLEDKKRLYSNARSSIKGLKSKTDFEVEEYLAEQFRNYVLNNGKVKVSDVTKSFFKRMIDYIKSIFFGPQSIDEIFDRLYKGKIQNYNPNINNILFKRLNAGITNSIGDNLFDATQSITVVKSIDRIIYDFIHSYDKSVVDVLNEPKIIQAAYKYSYRVFSDKLIALRDKFEADLDNVETEEEISQLESNLIKQSDKFNRLLGNWNDIIAYHQSHSKTFVIKGDNIYFTYDDEGNILEENDDSATEKPKNSFESVQGNEISSIDGANKETKALVRGLAKQTFNEFGIQELVDFGSTWNNLALNLAGIMEYSEMMKKLGQLSTAFPEYTELLTKLNVDKDKSTLTHNQISQIAKFRQDFSKPYVGIYETVFDPATQTYKLLESTKSNISAIEDEFSNNFITASPSLYITRDKYGTNLLNNNIKDLKVGTLQQRLDFLRAIGVQLSEGTIKDKRAETVISGKAISAIKSSLLKLIESGVPVTSPLAQVRTPNPKLELPGEAGNIDAILRLESTYNRNNASASMLNAEGSTVYALSLNNFLTVSNYYLSNYEAYPTYQDVIAQPHMRHLSIANNPYVKNSVWLNNMFILDVEETDPSYGNRRSNNGEPVVLEIINYNGLKVQQEQGASEGSTTTSLWIGDKLVQDFNSLLTSGVKELMRAGDKASAFAIKINGYKQQTGRASALPIAIEYFNNSWGGLATTETFAGYLFDELTRIQRATFSDIGSDLDYYNKSSKNFNLFRDILPDIIKDQIISELKVDTDINTLVQTHLGDLKAGLREYFEKQVTEKKSSFANYQFTFANPTWIDGTLRASYSTDQLLRAYVVNAFILNVEQTKIFNGDGAFYKAFHKRNSKDTSTGTTLMTDQWFIDWINQDPNANLQSKILGVNNPINNVTNTVVFSDNVTPSSYIDIYKRQLAELGVPTAQINDIVSKYQDANEGDAQGWITLDFYRTFKLAQGKWYPQHEAIYQKASRGQELTSDEVFYFMPIKAQYAGPLQYDGAFAPAFHKFSLMPLLPSVIKGTKMEAMNEKMIRNNVGYGLFESGSKVATILDDNGSKEPFYVNYAEREATDPQEAFNTVNPIFNHYLKEQVNIEPSLHDEVIFGTQFRKLLFQNLFNNGKALDEKWNALYKEYAHTLDQLVQNEKQRLLEELGMEETSTGYKNVDFTKLVDKFLKEAKRRDMNDNVQSFMEYDKDSKSFKYPLDASTNRQQIQNMIMSIINNRLIRQHMKGDLMVQVSGAGLEGYTTPTEGQKAEYGTNGLRFYHLKNGKTQSMQVKVPLTGDFENLLFFTHVDGQQIGTRERLNEMLRNEEWLEENRKAVTMIGYRIPTQGLNSIEFMEVAEFLPAEAGNILILPTEIVVKAGSDFDIDKLSIFKPSIRTRVKGKVTSATYTTPKFLSLKTSLGTQKDALKAETEPKLLALRNEMTRLSDSRYLDTRWYGELKKQLKDTLNEDVSEAFDNLLNLNHERKHTELEITFVRNDLDLLVSEHRIEPTEELDLNITTKREELRNLNQRYSSLQTQITEARAALTSARYTRSGLLDAANNVIENYYDNYYASLGKVNDTYQELYTDYKNKLEDIYSFKGGLQNRIIEIGRQVLEDKANFVQLITPNDTGLIKPMITDAGGIKQRNGYPLKTDYTGTAIYSEKTQEEKFLAGLVGRKALGIAAVNNTFTQLFQIIGLNVNGEYIIDGSQRGIIKTFIRLLPQAAQDKFDFSNSVDEKGILKSEFVSQMINAYVDVLNDDFIFYANAGLDVAPILFYMKNAGVSTEKMFYFINHPVVKYFINNTQATKSHILKAIYPETYDPNKRPEMSGSFKNQLFKALVGTPKAKIADVRNAAIINANENKEFFTEEYLKGQISKDLTKISYKERSAILGHFLQLQEQAELLRKFQASNSYDTSTAPNPVASENFNKLADEVAGSGFIDKTYQKAMSETVIQAYNVTDFVSQMFDNLMPTTLSKDLVSSLLNSFEDIKDRDRLTRLYTNDLLLYIFTNYVKLENLQGTPTPFDYVNGTETIPSMNKFTVKTVDGKKVMEDNRLSKRIRALKNDPRLENLRRDFPIIGSIRVQEVDKNTGLVNLSIYRGENNTDTQNSLIEQFSRLANLSDEQYEPKMQLYIRKVFRDLALYGFLQSGLNKSPISFTDIIPNELYTPLVSKGIEAFQADLQARGFNTVMSEYKVKFQQNNPELFEARTNIASYKYKNYKMTNESKAPQSVNSIKVNGFSTTPEKLLEVANIFTNINADEESERIFPEQYEYLSDFDFTDREYEYATKNLDLIINLFKEWYKAQEPTLPGFITSILSSNQRNKDDNQGTLFYGNLENQQENRIFNSRNSYTDNEVQDVLSRMEEQSKPCNS